MGPTQGEVPPPEPPTGSLVLTLEDDEVDEMAGGEGTRMEERDGLVGSEEEEKNYTASDDAKKKKKSKSAKKKGKAKNKAKKDVEDDSDDSPIQEEFPKSNRSLYAGLIETGHTAGAPTFELALDRSDNRSPTSRDLRKDVDR
ncbi:uncharacterized protein MELLADRAFT_106866 [Melampsora larici-populina 98AG31]|uniref:Uncharacterized protein n=1 Tax=Melampsora larici-populina (strain 98AG31 / pathotype 3-4-7) TaxID=747676 RepID=F4RMX1_MELLP|nr:uncharacterized protein MELLADRAFT_106866 [Melampsora larici-populina 98AG31]EGG06310.1 hypothetical protein MELLADRAFT_106866 [Melampsora larici-populina 98AG31]